MGFEATPIIASAADTVSLQVYGMTCVALELPSETRTHRLA